MLSALGLMSSIPDDIAENNKLNDSSRSDLFGAEFYAPLQINYLISYNF